jgi:hypothetical protein
VIHEMIRKAFAAAVGTAQVMIGALLIIYTYVLYYDLFNVQSTFRIPIENAPLYALLLLIFGLFSLVSGLSFIQEGRSYA